jgi:hypothetical protein
MLSLILPVVVTLAGDVSVGLSGAPRSTPVPGARVVAQAWPGAPTQAPPPPVFERVAPRRGWIWVPGRHEWRMGRYVWLRGHWERERVGWIWQPGRWEFQGGRYVWVDGQWVVAARQAPPQPMAMQPVPAPPVPVGPPPMAAMPGPPEGTAPGVSIEVAPAMPAPPVQEAMPPQRPGFVWVRGAHEWRGGRYVWIGGHWEPERRGLHWIPGHWERRGRRQFWVEGRWVR